MGKFVMTTSRDGTGDAHVCCVSLIRPGLDRMSTKAMYKDNGGSGFGHVLCNFMQAQLDLILDIISAPGIVYRVGSVS